MRNLRILCYHGIAKAGEAARLSGSIFPTEDEFRKQMAYLKERSRVISLDEVWRHCKDGTHPREFSAAVTFDDGVASTATAARVMKELGMPLAVFLSTRYIGSDELPWFMYLDSIVALANERGFAAETRDEYHVSRRKGLRLFRATAKGFILASSGEQQRQVLEGWAGVVGTSLAKIRAGRREFLDWDEVRRLAGEGVTFGSHTWSHLDLRTLNGEDLEREFSQAKSDIREHLQPEHARFVAYPDGRFDSRVLEAARRHHEMAFADRYRYASWGDMLRLPRRGINGGRVEAISRGLLSRRELASWVKERLRAFLGQGYPAARIVGTDSEAGLSPNIVPAEK